MITATITWITYNNYGTELQAYSLQQFLIKNGIENIIISDKRIIEEKRDNIKKKAIDNDKIRSTCECNTNRVVSFQIIRRLKYLFMPLKAYRLFLTIVKEKKLQKNRNIFLNSIEKFYVFKKENLIISDDYDRGQIELLNDKYDCFIAGSDQIWSPLEINFDGYYFLNFAKKKKGSYAPSFGTMNIPLNKRNEIQKFLKDFSFCSVREQKSALQLSKDYRIKTEWVCDPTLLFDIDFWKEFGSNYRNKGRKAKYILCYFLENKKWYFDYAEKLSRHLKKKLLLIPNKDSFCEYKIMYKKPVGPKEFVALFSDADFVLTDSYHGTIFSFIFQKQIIHLKRFADSADDCQNLRVYSLLEYLDLMNIIIEKKDFEDSDLSTIDYSKIILLLNKFREKSRKFLLDNLLE